MAKKRKKPSRQPSGKTGNRVTEPKRDNAPKLRPKRRILFRVFIGLLWIVAILAAIEFYARYSFAKIEKRNPLAADYHGEMTAFSAAGDRAWLRQNLAYQPNVTVRATYGDREFVASTNEHGFRDDAVVLPKPPDIYRIVCIGGSTTAEGYTNDTSYPALLEKALQRLLDTDRVEVINCGISGLTTPGQLVRLPDYLRLQPDLVLEYNAVNDICWLLAPQWRFEHNYLQSTLAKSAFARQHLTELLQPNQSQVDKYLSAVTLANVAKIIQEVRATGAEMMISSFAHPTLADLTPEEQQFLDHNLRQSWGVDYMSLEEYVQIVNRYNELLAEMCEQKHVRLIPLASQLTGGTDVFKDICHVTPKGAEMKAEIIAADLQDYVAQQLQKKPKQAIPQLQPQQ